MNMFKSALLILGTITLGLVAPMAIANAKVVDQHPRHHRAVVVKHHPQVNVHPRHHRVVVVKHQVKHQVK